MTLDFVVPRIYAALPKVGESDITLSFEASPVDEKLAADLHVLYAFDLDSHYQIFSQADLERFAISKEALHERALANLRALKLEVRAHKGDRIFMLTAGGNYEATLFLLPEVWVSVASMVSGNIVASVPARDVLYVTGDSEQENLANLRHWTSHAIERVDKPLSRSFLRWNGETWDVYEGFAA